MFLFFRIKKEKERQKIQLNIDYTFQLYQKVKQIKLEICYTVMLGVILSFSSLYEVSDPAFQPSFLRMTTLLPLAGQTSHTVNTN